MTYFSLDNAWSWYSEPAAPVKECDSKKEWKAAHLESGDESWEDLRSTKDVQGERDNGGRGNVGGRWLVKWSEID